MGVAAAFSRFSREITNDAGIHSSAFAGTEGEAQHQVAVDHEDAALAAGAAKLSLGQVEPLKCLTTVVQPLGDAGSLQLATGAALTVRHDHQMPAVGDGRTAQFPQHRQPRVGGRVGLHHGQHKQAGLDQGVESDRLTVRPFQAERLDCGSSCGIFSVIELDVGVGVRLRLSTGIGDDAAK